MRNQDIGRRLRILRGERSQQEVSSGTGINIDTYQQYECGKKKPKDDILFLLAKYYEVPVPELFF